MRYDEVDDARKTPVKHTTPPDHRTAAVPRDEALRNERVGGGRVSEQHVVVFLHCYIIIIFLAI